MDNPTKIGHYRTKELSYAEWHKNGIYLGSGGCGRRNSLHRVDAPARLSFFKDGKIEEARWYQDGKPYKERGPTEIWFYEDLGRDGYRRSVRQKCWYDGGGFLDRGNLPSRIQYYRNGNVKQEEYGKVQGLHRVSGPALIKYDKRGFIIHEEYFLNHKSLPKEEWLKTAEVQSYLFDMITRQFLTTSIDT